MPRRMSCSMTVDAVRAHTKTVTRRHVDTWRTLKPGDRLTLIEKGMGLPKGTRQVVLAEVEIVDVRVEPIRSVTLDDVAAEGFAGWTVGEFRTFWLRGHGYPVNAETEFHAPCRRIEWRYLDVAAA